MNERVVRLMDESGIAGSCQLCSSQTETPTLRSLRILLRKASRQEVQIRLVDMIMSMRCTDECNAKELELMMSKLKF